MYTQVYRMKILRRLIYVSSLTSLAQFTLEQMEVWFYMLSTVGELELAQQNGVVILVNAQVRKRY